MKNHSKNEWREFISFIYQREIASQAFRGHLPYYVASRRMISSLCKLLSYVDLMIWGLKILWEREIQFFNFYRSHKKIHATIKIKNHPISLNFCYNFFYRQFFLCYSHFSIRVERLDTFIFWNISYSQHLKNILDLNGCFKLRGSTGKDKIVRTLHLTVRD